MSTLELDFKSIIELALAFDAIAQAVPIPVADAEYQSAFRGLVIAHIFEILELERLPANFQGQLIQNEQVERVANSFMVFVAGRIWPHRNSAKYTETRDALIEYILAAFKITAVPDRNMRTGPLIAGLRDGHEVGFNGDHDKNNSQRRSLGEEFVAVPDIYPAPDVCPKLASPRPATERVPRDAISIIHEKPSLGVNRSLEPSTEDYTDVRGMDLVGMSPAAKDVGPDFMDNTIHPSNLRTEDFIDFDSFQGDVGGAQAPLVCFFATEGCTATFDDLEALFQHEIGCAWRTLGIEDVGLGTDMFEY